MSTNGSLPPEFYIVESMISSICMVFVAVTIPLYIMVLMIMFVLRNHSYCGMFYRIFMIGGVVDVIAIINNYVGAIFPAKSWLIDVYLSQGTMIGHIYLVLAWGTRCTQGITITLLALNRATAVCSPLRHRRIWNSPWANMVFVVHLGLGFSVGAALVPQRFHWKQQANGYYIQFNDPDFRQIFFKTAYALNTVAFMITLIANIVMIITFRRKYRMRSAAPSTKTASSQRHQSEKQRQENNLSIVVLVTCFSEISFYCYIVYAFVINPYMNTQVFYLIYNMLNDIYGGIGPWLMLALSTSLRLHLKNLLRVSSSKHEKDTMKILRISGYANIPNFDLEDIADYCRRCGGPKEMKSVRLPMSSVSVINVKPREH